ncbi:MAG: hypothetical protein E6I88_11995 [Chloroflexi bacterium]|nr:MAG: hypothetical protein E6I88_11995 [Chloroflexota bacterium]TME44551.1 MAG: hypothetical protein E6I56_11900 [Chloroflexota bacterium]
MPPQRRALATAGLSWLTLAGVVSAAAGLAWDAVLHARDPLLAQHESVITAANPAHALIAAGLAIALLSQAVLMFTSLPRLARRVFAAAAAALAVALVAVIGWSAQVSAGQTAEMQRFVASTKAGIEQYQNPQAAYQAGYQPITPINLPIVEWVNPTYTRAGRVLDLRRPERLMYMAGPAGPILVGAMFVLPTANQPVPRVAGGLAHWHQHLDLCYLPNGTIAGTNGYGQPCPLGTRAKPTPAMLHVWIVPNPAGAFADDLLPAAMQSIVAHE